jgi:imidazoleglycerol-phosphate dehydratase
MSKDVQTPPRSAQVSRKTKETDIRIALNLDGTGAARIDTGIPFLDHMLDLFARHGLFDLEVECRGDLEIDDHHSVEDVAIALARHSCKLWDKAASLVTA